jgi:hypothetical protein
MQNCPSCQMLMEDHEALCPSCAQERDAVPTLLGTPAFVLPASGPGGGSTAVLDRPVAVPMPGEIHYRQPGEHRRAWTIGVLLAVLVGAAAVLLTMAVRGDGPLADVLVDAGVLPPPAVHVPDSWTNVSSEAGAFTVTMPAGAKELDGIVDAQNPAAGSTHGFETRLGEGGSTAVVSTDFGMAPGTLAGMDDPAAFNGLVDSMVAGMVGATDGGAETVRREIPVGNGRAVDAVVVDDVAGVTTRVRYLLANGRMYAVVTTGSDEGADDLDEVHARMLATFEVSD